MMMFLIFLALGGVVGDRVHEMTRIIQETLLLALQEAANVIFIVLMMQCYTQHMWETVGR
jgi:hypothetical protein